MIDLASEKHSQLDLFNPPTAKPALMLTLDYINQRYGSDTLFVVAQGIEQKWAMRRLNTQLNGEVCRVLSANEVMPHSASARYRRFVRLTAS